MSNMEHHLRKKSDSDPGPDPSIISNFPKQEVSLAMNPTNTNKACPSFEGLCNVPTAALQLQIQTSVGSPRRSAGFSNRTVSPSRSSGRYFVPRSANVGPLSKRRRTPRHQPRHQPNGRLPNRPLPMVNSAHQPTSILSNIKTTIPPPMTFGGLSTNTSKGNAHTPRTPKRKAGEAIGPPVGAPATNLSGTGVGAGGLGLSAGASTGVGVGVGVGPAAAAGMIGGGPLGVAGIGGALRGAGMGTPIDNLRVSAPISTPCVSGPVTRPLSGGIPPQPLSGASVGPRPLSGGLSLDTGSIGPGTGLGGVNQIGLRTNRPVIKLPITGTGPINLGAGRGATTIKCEPGKTSAKRGNTSPRKNPRNIDPQTGKPKVAKRNRHNATERTRTRVISRKISELGDQMTKAGVQFKKEKLLILNAAVQYVRQLRDEVAQQDAETKRLEEEIVTMRQNLHILSMNKDKQPQPEKKDPLAFPVPTPASKATPTPIPPPSFEGAVKIDYEKAFMSQPLPSLLMDDNFSILSCNGLFLLFVNKSNGMVVGKTLPEILYPEPALKANDWNRIRRTFPKAKSVKLEDLATIDGVTMRFQLVMSQSFCQDGRKRVEAVFLPFLPSRNPAHDNTLRPIRSWKELYFALV